MVDNGRSRRLRAGLTGLALVAALLAPAVTAPSAQATEPTTTDRIAGETRFGTAAEAAQASFPNGSDTVVLATGIDFPDALAAGGLGGALDAPVLLVAKDVIPDPTADALVELGVETAFVVGGTGVISEDVVQALEADDIDVTRVSGRNRFETAAEVARQIDATDVNPVSDADGVGTVDGELTGIVVTGQAFPDAVSASQVAFAGRFPILPINPDGNPDVIEDVIDELGITNVLVIGGSGVIPAARITELQQDTGVETATRLAGANRWATSVDVAVWAIENLDFDPELVFLANGLNFADALGGAALAGSGPNPLVLTAPEELPEPTLSFIAERAGAIDAITALGGTAAINADTLTAAAQAAILVNSEVLDVGPDEAESLDQSGSALSNDGSREYTASGLTPDTEYTIALLDPATVNRTAGGTTFVSFTRTDGPSTSIETVNGSPVAAAGSGGELTQTTGTATAQGGLTFTVDATAPDSVIPVVYEDTDGNEQLNISQGQASEPFGTGGAAAWLPAEAPTDNYASLEVLEVNRELNYFVADADVNDAPPRGNRAFFLDASDRYTLGGSASGRTAFLDALSPRDVVAAEYFVDGQSKFTLTRANDDIPDITGITASYNAAGTRVTIDWNASSQPDVEYRIYADTVDGDPTDPKTPDGDGSIPPDLDDDDDGNGVDDEGRGSDGVLDRDADGVIVERIPAGGAQGPTTSRTITPIETVDRYFILPVATGTGAEDTIRDTPDQFGQPVEITFSTNELRPDSVFELLTYGASVHADVGISTASAGDIILLNLSRAVTVSGSATLQVSQRPGLQGDRVTIRNGSNSAWSVVNGRTVRIELGSGIANEDEITWAQNHTFDDDGDPATAQVPATNIVGLSGVTAADGATPTLRDLVLEEGGPELMPGSSTCTEGTRTCTITFNEFVDPDTAVNTAFYGYDGGLMEGIQSITLGSDGQTITIQLTQGGAIDADDELTDNSNGPTGVAAEGDGGVWQQPRPILLLRPGTEAP